MFQDFYQEDNKSIQELLNKELNYYMHIDKQLYQRLHLLQEKLMEVHIEF